MSVFFITRVDLRYKRIEKLIPDTTKSNKNREKRVNGHSVYGSSQERLTKFVLVHRVIGVLFSVYPL